MTILFREDWDKYPTAQPDYNCKNKSFIRLAALYRDMGIKNNNFFLATHDPDLIGVDPYDYKNLDRDLIGKIMIECKDNFWYFLREITRDPAGSDDHPILFKANRGVMSAYFCFLTHMLFILIMIRQTGKSFGIDWLYTWLLNIRLTKSEISFITKDEKLRGREVERLKSMELTLPYYMKQRDKRDPGNTEVIRISSMDNTFKLYVPNRSPKIADLIGRGMTAGITGGDELAYLANSSITIPVMLSASLAAREVAQIKNEPYGTIFTTTSGKRDTPEGKYAYNLVNNAAIWSERFFDARNEEHLHSIVLAAAPGKKLHVNCTFNHQQLGYSDAWLKKRLEEALVEDPVQARADYFNEWPSGTTTTPFRQEDAEAIRNSECVDYYTEVTEPEPYALRWYYKENEIQAKLQTPHVLSIDPSEAVGRDGIGIVLINTETGELAMAADISEANIHLFSKWLGMFLVKNIYVTVIIERRSMGTAICDFLVLYLIASGIDPFTRIYNQVVQYADDQPDRFKVIQYSGMNEEATRVFKPMFGWSTSGSGLTSRTALYGKTMNGAVKHLASMVRDRKLILQLLGLEIRGGRIDHGEGEHDDLVIAWLLAFWLLTSGRNLKHYGINPSTVLTRNPVYQKGLVEESAYDSYVGRLSKIRVEALTEAIKKERDEFIIRRLEYDLEKAIAGLSETDRQIVSADDLINRLREEKRKSGGSFLSYHNQPAQMPSIPTTGYREYEYGDSGMTYYSC